MNSTNEQTRLREMSQMLRDEAARHDKSATAEPQRRRHYRATAKNLRARADRIDAQIQQMTTVSD